MARWICGADGCRAGWVRALLEIDSDEVRFDVVSSARDLLATDPAPAIVGLDIPIGLPEAGARECDRAARRLLGPRRHSVFPAPIRGALAARSREEAARRTQRVDGRRISAQAWNLFPKIREVDELMRREPRARARIREVHPELSFRAWASGQPMRSAKKTAAGRRERLALAEAWLGPRLLARARAGRRRSELADDDILDAVAALWTARRMLRGEAGHLPEEVPRDASGLPMEIVY